MTDQAVGQRRPRLANPRGLRHLRGRLHDAAARRRARGLYRRQVRPAGRAHLLDYGDGGADLPDGISVNTASKNTNEISIF